jgi:hypothetical protein
MEESKKQVEGMIKKGFIYLTPSDFRARLLAEIEG